MKDRRSVMLCNNNIWQVIENLFQTYTQSLRQRSHNNFPLRHYLNVSQRQKLYYENAV